MSPSWGMTVRYVISDKPKLQSRRSNTFVADWRDHGRDLLTMINQFQDQFPQPIIGIGHSMGGMQL
jgi:pimeloyl-ACP methyl ester carboxylesterase